MAIPLVFRVVHFFVINLTPLHASA